MSLIENLTQLLTPAVNDAGFVLEEVSITPAGKRRMVAVVIDREDSNPSLDEVTQVSKSVSEILDNYSQLGTQPFTLEVTTPGVDRPLTQSRHWRKNIGRLVKITSREGERFVARITSVSDDGVMLDLKNKVVMLDFTNIKRAIIEIEFNRKDGAAR
jgi:ribosome maturation factor RimP